MTIQKIGVLGLWHLGSVTAACLARHFHVIGFDPNLSTIENLRLGRAPLYEPGLNELIKERLDAGKIEFHPADQISLSSSPLDLLWVTFDTPVDEEDLSDLDAVLVPLRDALAQVQPGLTVIISAQMPVGTCAQLEREFAEKKLEIVCVPENLRLGQGLVTFSEPERFVAGVRTLEAKEKLTQVLGRFTETLVWMSPESAEMTKHALNSFLALSVTFANEVARLCEVSGADMLSVTAGLKSDKRIGPRAYLAPGEAFAGGTLARDVVTLNRLAENAQEKLFLLPSICPSNEAHKDWAWHKLKGRFDDFSSKKITLLGLSYKPGTDTLRRSSAVELARKLSHSRAQVWAWDPVVKALPEHLSRQIKLAGSLGEAVRDADAVIITTPWPEFREADWSSLIPTLRTPLILDAGRFLQKNLPSHLKTTYLAVGVL